MDHLGKGLNFLGLIANGVGIKKGSAHHSIEVEKAQERHSLAIKLAKEQHERDIKTIKQTYLLTLFNNLEQHFQQMNADLISSSRESERDMFDQRNHGFQTLILSSSVMFSALSTVIVQGYLEPECGQICFIAYALTSALSFAFLFLCIVLCMEIVMRASSFMYLRSNVHSKQLKDAIDKTATMMDKISQGSRKVNFKNIIELDDENLKDRYNKHEDIIKQFISDREEINQKAADLSLKKKSFEQFWKTSIKHWAKAALLFFYFGTLNLLFALCIFMWSQFEFKFHSLAAAIIAIAFVGTALVVSVVVVIYWKIQAPLMNGKEDGDDTPNGQRAQRHKKRRRDSYDSEDGLNNSSKAETPTAGGETPGNYDAYSGSSVQREGHNDDDDDCSSTTPSRRSSEKLDRRTGGRSGRVGNGGTSSSRLSQAVLRRWNSSMNRSDHRGDECSGGGNGMQWVAMGSHSNSNGRRNIFSEGPLTAVVATADHDNNNNNSYATYIGGAAAADSSSGGVGGYATYIGGPSQFYAMAAAPPVSAATATVIDHSHPGDIESQLPAADSYAAAAAVATSPTINGKLYGSSSSFGGGGGRNTATSLPPPPLPSPLVPTVAVKANAQPPQPAMQRWMAQRSDSSRNNHAATTTTINNNQGTTGNYGNRPSSTLFRNGDSVADIPRTPLQGPRTLSLQHPHTIN